MMFLTSTLQKLYQRVCAALQRNAAAADRLFDTRHTARTLRAARARARLPRNGHQVPLRQPAPRGDPRHQSP